MVPIGQVDNLRRELAEIDIPIAIAATCCPISACKHPMPSLMFSGVRERGDNEFPGIEFPLNDFLAFPFKKSLLH